ncbi:MAG TPA: hypothetical protein VLZ28_08155, partial [Daejeonella sp.]|nr:hypothetical protein [Daejeonella sp.]
MKKLQYLSLIFMFFLFSCKKDNPIDLPEPVTNETISGIITENMTLKTDVKYLLKGKVYVKNNAILSVPAGVTIEVEKADEPANKGALIITKGAKLIIDGTADKPVVFTSASA